MFSTAVAPKKEMVWKGQCPSHLVLDSFIMELIDMENNYHNIYLDCNMIIRASTLLNVFSAISRNFKFVSDKVYPSSRRLRLRLSDYASVVLAKS